MSEENNLNTAPSDAPEPTAASKAEVEESYRQAIERGQKAAEAAESAQKAANAPEAGTSTAEGEFADESAATDADAPVQDNDPAAGMKRFLMGGGMMGGGMMGGGSGRKKVRYPKPETLGLPKINLGAMFMPPIWGPAHGNWLTILFYPIWVLADDLFYAAYSTPSPLTIILAILTFVLLAGATVMYAMRSQAPAYARALEHRRTREQFLKTERIWAVAMGIFALVLIVVATWYNVVYKPSMGM